MTQKEQIFIQNFYKLLIKHKIKPKHSIYSRSIIWIVNAEENEYTTMHYKLQHLWKLIYGDLNGENYDFAKWIEFSQNKNDPFKNDLIELINNRDNIEVDKIVNKSLQKFTKYEAIDNNGNKVYGFPFYLCSGSKYSGGWFMKTDGIEFDEIEGTKDGSNPHCFSYNNDHGRLIDITTLDIRQQPDKIPCSDPDCKCLKQNKNKIADYYACKCGEPYQLRGIPIKINKKLEGRGNYGRGNSIIRHDIGWCMLSEHIDFWKGDNREYFYVVLGYDPKHMIRFKYDTLKLTDIPMYNENGVYYD